MAELIISKHVSLSYILCRFFSVSFWGSETILCHFLVLPEVTQGWLGLHHVGLTAMNLSRIDGRGWPLAQGLGAKAPESWRFSLSRVGVSGSWKVFFAKRTCWADSADLTITPRLLGSRHRCSSSRAFPQISPHFRGVFVIFPKKAMAIWCFTVQPWSDGFCTHQIKSHVTVRSTVINPCDLCRSARVYPLSIRPLANPL